MSTYERESGSFQADTNFKTITPTGSTLAVVAKWNETDFFIANSTTLTSLTFTLPKKPSFPGALVSITAQSAITTVVIYDGFGNVVPTAPVAMVASQVLRFYYISRSAGWALDAAPGNLSNVTSPQAARFNLEVPINATCVTDPLYGAVDDAMRGNFACTWTISQPQLTIATATYNITVANTGTWQGQTVAQVTFPGNVGGNVTGMGIDWVGKPIAITGAGTAGGTLVALVVDFFYDQTNSYVATIVLNKQAPTTLTASSQTFACPCFTTGSDGTGLPSSVGKSIYANNLGGPFRSGGSGNLYNIEALIDTIVSVNTPFQVTLVNNMTLPSQTSKSFTTVVWGTDNSAAVQAAGLAAVQAGQKTLFFPGHTSTVSTGTFACFNWLPNTVSAPTTQAYKRTSTMSQLQWITSDKQTDVLLFSGPTNNTWDDFTHKHASVPWNSPAPPPPTPSIDATSHLPRCNTTNVITVVVIGDSWGTANPSGNGGNDHYSLLTAYIQRHNPGNQG